MDQEFVPPPPPPKLGETKVLTPLAKIIKFLVTVCCLISVLSGRKKSWESGINAWHIATSHDLLHKRDIDERPYN